MDRLVKPTKEFLNRDAYLEVQANTARETLGMVEVIETDGADATGGEPIFTPEGKAVGRISSGAYGYHVQKSLGLAFLNGASPGDAVDVMILGKPHRAVVLEAPPFDPEGIRLRA